MLIDLGFNTNYIYNSAFITVLNYKPKETNNLNIAIYNIT